MIREMAVHIGEVGMYVTAGGMMLLDHYSREFAPGEAYVIREFPPGVPFKQFPFGWKPAAYVIKG